MVRRLSRVKGVTGAARAGREVGAEKIEGTGQTSQ